MKNAVILVNGGGGNGVDVAIASTVKSLKERGYITRGIMGGVEGLLGGDIKDGHSVLLTDKPIDLTLEGSIIGCSREPFAIPEEKSEFYHQSYREWDNEKRAKRIEDNLFHELNADLFVVIGGDGTLRSLAEFFQYSPRLENITIALLNTMDNDGKTGTNDGGIQVPLDAGYPSAAYKLQRFTERQQRWAERYKCVVIHETFGRDKGWTTAATSLGAPIVILPEFILDKKIRNRFVERVEHEYKANGKQLCIGVSEGARFSGDIVQELSDIHTGFKPEKDGLYHRVYLTVPPGSRARKLGGAAYVIQLLLHKDLPKLKTYVWLSEYAARAADPETGLGAIPFDIKYNILLGNIVGELAESGIRGVVPTLSNVVGYDDLSINSFRENPLRIRDIEQVGLPPEYLNKDDITIDPRFTDYLRKITSGPKNLTGEERDRLNRTLTL